MTSATARQNHTAWRRQGEGSWMVVFASALLAMVGFFNLIDGIAAIANSDYLVNQLLFANLDVSPLSRKRTCTSPTRAT
jgi:hypothetical protein